MRAVVQRVAEAQVTVAGAVVGAIGPGLLILLGVATDDQLDDARRLARKIVELRIFPDEAGKMNRSLLETQGAALVVSQFTLYGDFRKGRRPSFVQAAGPELAIPLYEGFVAAIREEGILVATGRFGADMDVQLVNQGPVTLWLDTREKKEPG